MTLHFFPSFFDHPTKIRFAQQEPDEHIELLLRQHWVINVPWLVLAVIAVFLPLFLISLNQSMKFIDLSQIPNDLLAAALILWYMLILAYIIEKFLHWYFNIYIVTDKHLVDINFHNLLSRDITEVRLDDVQSAKSHIVGIIGSLFHFGDVIIETAAERQQIQFLAVPKPDFVKDRIQDLQETQEGGNGDVG